MTKKQKESMFRVKISNCGINHPLNTVSFGISENINAVQLLGNAMNTIAQNTVGLLGDDKPKILLYHTSVWMLSLIMKKEAFIKAFPEFTDEKLKQIKKDWDLKRN